MVFPKTPRPSGRGVFVVAWLFLLCPVLALAADCSLHQLPRGMQHHRVVVASISDGDTLTLKDGRRVRLIGINTPELRPPGRGQEPFASEAKRALEMAVKKGDQAYLVTDRETRDRHGRTLGHLFNRKGENLEARLLASGLAWHVAVPPNLALADCLAAVEQRARSQKLGVWTLLPVAATAVEHGGFQRVRGRVEKVTFAKGWWLNLEGGLSAVIYRENQQRFQKSWLRRLEGKTVELQGWVYPVAGAEKPWRMKLETSHAIDMAGTH